MARNAALKLTVRSISSSCSPDDTQRVAAELANSLQPGAVLALRGPVGAGKTVFAKGLADALDVSEPLTSATFTIIGEYNGRYPVVHADLYRLHGSDEARETGLEEWLAAGSAVVVVEWADRAVELFCAGTLWVDIAIESDGTRTISVQHQEADR